MSPSERERLQALYNEQRIAELKALQALKEEEGLDDVTVANMANGDNKTDYTFAMKDAYQRRVASEGDYIKRTQQERGINIDEIPNEQARLRSSSLTESQKAEIEVKERVRKNEQVKIEAEQRFSGAWFRKYQTQADKLEEVDEFSRATTSGKMLDEFIAESERPVDEDDDDDIYQQYQEMASRSGEVRESEGFRRFQPDGAALKPDVPRFDEHFKAEADGIHPFDRITNDFRNEDVTGSREEAEAEQEREEELYKREILGRLMGQTLTPSQFELIAGF